MAVSKFDEKEALVILGNQLFPSKHFARRIDKKTPVFMSEDRALCTHYRYHKHKLVFFLTAMRDYAVELGEKGYTVNYNEFSNRTFFENLEDFVSSHSLETLVVFEIEDKFFEGQFLKFAEERGLEIEVLESPMFVVSRQRFKDYLGRVKKPFMKTFYESERHRTGFLMDSSGEPFGGKFSFDSDNRNKLAKDVEPPELKPAKKSQNLKAVSSLVDREFSSHPGQTDNFWLPTSRSDSKAWLKSFLKYRFRDYGTYQDSITERSDFVFHSVLSPMINAGLLLPEEVIKESLKYAEKENIPLNSVEGFLRQVLGWREFVRGIYQNFSDRQDESNFWGHQRELSDCWYSGETGIPPLDYCIKKALRYSYNHHIERLMVVANLMLLCEIRPKAAHAWFMEMYADSSDWVMGPNVYGMGLFSDGGIFATKPYICGSNYLLKMSDYKKDPSWCDPLDGLYWRFIEKNKEFFGKNPRLSMMVRTLEKMKPERKETIFSAADRFIEKVTCW